MAISMTKTAKPYDMSKAKEKPSLRGLFSTMVIKPGKEAPEEMGSEEEYEEEGMEEEGEEMSKEEHIQAAMASASEAKSALKSEDISGAMEALDALESHLEKCY